MDNSISLEQINEILDSLRVSEMSRPSPYTPSTGSLYSRALAAVMKWNLRLKPRWDRHNVSSISCFRILDYTKRYLQLIDEDKLTKVVNDGYEARTVAAMALILSFKIDHPALNIESISSKIFRLRKRTLCKKFQKFWMALHEGVLLPNAWEFMECFLTKHSSSFRYRIQEIKAIAGYLLYVCASDAIFPGVEESKLAAASIYAAKSLRFAEPFTSSDQRITWYSKKDLDSVVVEIEKALFRSNLVVSGKWEKAIGARNRKRLLNARVDKKRIFDPLWCLKKRHT